jgi:hypothetical protein
MKKILCTLLSFILLLLPFAAIADGEAGVPNRILYVVDDQIEFLDYTLTGQYISSYGNAAAGGEYQYVFEATNNYGAVISTLNVHIPCALVDNEQGHFDYNGIGQENRFDYYSDLCMVLMENAFGDVKDVTAIILKDGSYVQPDTTTVYLKPTNLFTLKITPSETNPDMLVVGLYIDTPEELVHNDGTVSVVSVLLVGGLEIPKVK